jgi:hypothetical protein
MHFAEVQQVLYKVADMRSIERQVVPLWLRERRDAILLQPRISALLFPNVHLANFYKKQLLDTYPTLAGLHFITPSRVRAVLKESAEMEVTLASREDMFMLAHLALQRTSSDYFLQLRENPKILVQALDALMQAGWEMEQISVEFKPFAQELNLLLREANLMTAQQLDGQLSQLVLESSPFQSVLAIGFSGKDWSQYRILQALQHHCHDFAMCVNTLCNSEADRLWLSTWEHRFKNVECTDVEEGGEWVNRVEQNPSQPIEIKITEHESDEIEGIIYHVLDILARHPESNIGIITSEPSTISRELSLRFQQLDIPHNDCIRFNAPEPANILALQRWVEMQHAPYLSNFLALIDQLHALTIVSDKEMKFLNRDLTQAFNETLNDSMDVLIAYLSRAQTDSSVRSLEILQKWCVLPKESKLKELVALTEDVCAELLPEGVRLVLVEKLKRLGSLFQSTCAGITFADWIYTVGHSPGRTAEAKGKFPFARIHLVSEHQSYGMSFDYVIFASMTKSNWPRSVPEHPLLTDAVMLHLNREAEMQGRHGQGDRCIDPKRGYMLCQSDKKAQQHDRFVELLRNAQRGVILIASVNNSTTNPNDKILSEYLLELAWEHNIQLGPIVHSPAIYRVENKNENNTTNDVAIRNTLTAFLNRRNADVAFDGYGYCFEAVQKQNQRPILSCKAIEEAVQKPDKAWIKYVLGVSIPRDFAAIDGLALARGNWIHSWVLWDSQSPKYFAKPELNTWSASLKNKSQAQLNRITQVYADCKRTLPEWIQRLVFETLQQAQLLLRKTYEATAGFDYCGQEVQLDDVCIRFADDYSIETKGRIDVLFAKNLLGQLSADNEILIFDFKSGQATQALSKSNLKKGRGIQGALYGLGLSAINGVECDVGYVTSHHQNITMLKLCDMQEVEGLWRGIADMLESGKFGALPEQAYGMAATGEKRPLATTMIAPKVLQRKWELTHPLLHQSMEN